MGRQRDVFQLDVSDACIPKTPEIFLMLMSLILGGMSFAGITVL